MTDITHITMSPSAVILNEANINTGLIVKEKKLLTNPTLWHKVVVHNSENLHRDVVLKTILDSVHPLDLIPVFYQLEGPNASFLARNCHMAIEKLCQQHLVVLNPHNKEKPFKLMIILSFSSTNELQINVQENISKVLAKRYDSASKLLNLDNFCKDPDLDEYCTLSQPKIFYFVLHLSKHLAINNLKLTNNEIRLLSPLESIWGVKTLLSLDLRGNLIRKMSELNILKAMQITKLFLDGNPLCDDYDEFTYVQAAKEVCPKLEKLDGMWVDRRGFKPFRRNFVCNVQGQQLVNDFLEHYFSLYDCKNRTVLHGVYHNDAIFSLSCQYLSGHQTSVFANLSQYKSMARNIKQMSDLAKSNTNLVKGSENIIKALNKLPMTEHDPYTFTVDLMYYTVETAVLVVTGVFREPTENLLDVEKLLGFTRTFILQSLGNGEYDIVNEQLHVSNATTTQQQRAFKMVRVAKPSAILMQPASNDVEKKVMAETFKTITNLTLDWCKKCLEECNYDLKKTLVLFVDLYKLDKIPQEAFLRNNDDVVVENVKSDFESNILKSAAEDIKRYSNNAQTSLFTDTYHTQQSDMLEKPSHFINSVQSSVVGRGAVQSSVKRLNESSNMASHSKATDVNVSVRNVTMNINDYDVKDLSEDCLTQSTSNFALQKNININLKNKQLIQSDLNNISDTEFVSEEETAEVISLSDDDYNDEYWEAMKGY